MPHVEHATAAAAMPAPLADVVTIVKGISKALPFSPDTAARLAIWLAEHHPAEATAYAAALRGE